jgi:hypothetical protein
MRHGSSRRSATVVGAHGLWAAFAVLSAVGCAGVGDNASPSAGAPPDPSTAAAERPADVQLPVVDRDLQHDVSPPLRTLMFPPHPWRADKDEHEMNVEPLPNTRAPDNNPPDSAVQRSAPGGAAPTMMNGGFDGIGQGFSGPAGTFAVNAAPPDTDMAVGPSHIVQIVNSAIAIFDKSGGKLFGPTPTNALWTGFGGGCEANDDGDGVVVYDQAADRFVISQFSVKTAPFLQCVAVSATSDPKGSYFRYAFPETDFPDYPKMGVWPDAYYETFNMFSATTGKFVGARACAFDRSNMLAGAPATQVCYQTSKSFGGLLPASVDGGMAPIAGTPNYVMSFGLNRLNLWRFHSGFGTPTTPATPPGFTGPINVTGVTAFAAACGGGGTCIPQPGTTQQLDSLADRLMYRLAYRNFGDHESLVLNHSVTVTMGASTTVGVRWYEVRAPSTTPTVAQQGTFAPDAKFRWMGSAGMDRNGDLALGYSLSSSTAKPSIYYTGRLATDPPNTLQGEAQLLAGTGVQSDSSRALSRWGDYASLVIDPSDDCTFWFSTEYIPSNGIFNWRTRIASFRFPTCVGGGGSDAGADSGADGGASDSGGGGKDGGMDSAASGSGGGSGGGGSGGGGSAGGGSGGGGSAGGGSGSGGSGGGVDAGSDSGAGDVPDASSGPPNPPTGLSAAILDRRRASAFLRWTAPSDASGGTVTGYQLRYAKVPLTDANFDDAAIATTAPYGGPPAGPGAADSAPVAGFYVESGTYFGVASVDGSGRRSGVVSTTTALTAHLNVTVLSGGGATNEEFGYQLESSGDVNGDKHADLIVGAFNGAHAYLYFGAVGALPTVPSVVFSGDATAPAFGRSVSIIGDIDHDGVDDLAIGNRSNPQRVYIYKGRASWPLTMTQADADYVITPDETYGTSSLFGTSIARLGDFDGDGIDDFAVGAPQYSGVAALAGRVVVVLGRDGFTSVALPDAARTIVIDGDPAIATGLFGHRVLGLGHFYAVSSRTTLVVGAPGSTAGAPGSEGHLYAFHGQSGASGVIPLASADHVASGDALRTRLGTTLANLGPLVSALPSVGSGNPTDRSVPTGSAWIFSGNAATGPFGSHLVTYQTAGTPSSNGEALLGGGVSGLDQSYSLIGGDAAPDLVQVPQSATSVFIIDGRAVVGAASPLEASTAAAVTVPLPPSFGTIAEGGARLLPDLDGDGYPDFAIAAASGPVPGKVAVFW